MARLRKIEGANWNYAQIWDKFPIPARPCKKELEIIKNEIKKFKGTPKVLILGSTIEYRSLCKELNISPTVVDFVKSNYDILTKYSNEKFIGEEFIETDWLKICDKNKYDFILGHRIYNVIEKKDIGKMFKIMYDALKSNGVFFCRGNIYDLKFKNKLDHFLNKYAFADREYPLFTYLEVALYMNCCNNENYIDYSKCRKLVNSWFKEKKISETEFKHISLLVSMSEEARFRTPNKIEIIQGIKKAGIKNVDWIITGDEFSHQMPIIKIKK